jgi:tetratricopeptide (TPR) repeat protein
MKTKLILSLVLTIATAAGCNSSHMKTQKAAATEQWNNARGAVLFSLATDQFNTGNLDKSRQTLDEAIKLEPENANFRVLWARIDIEQGKLESAVKTLDQAAKLDEKNPEIDYLQGVIQQRWQRPDLALVHYTKAAEKNPGDLAYTLAQAEMLVTQNRNADALKLLEDRAVYFEHSAAIRDAIAQLHDQQGNREQAISYYRQASVLDSDDDNIRERMALSMYRAQMWGDTLAQVERLLKKDAFAKRDDLMVVAGECQSNLGNTLEARNRFEEATRIDASCAAAWQGVARTSIELGDLRRASNAAQKSVALADRDPQAHLMLGMVQLRQQELSLAQKSFHRANQLQPNDPTTLCMLGLALQQSGQDKKAAELYAQALKADPSDRLAGRLLVSVGE